MSEVVRPTNSFGEEGTAQMTRIEGVAGAFPRQYCRQEEIAKALKRHWDNGLGNPKALDRLLNRVLLVLEEVMNRRRPALGSYSVLAAMGQGFCSELVLLRW